MGRRLDDSEAMTADEGVGRRQISPSISIPSFEELPRTGVYFLFQGDTVVYVGQAVNVRRRIADHIAEGFKIFDGVDAIPCRKSALSTVERRYISMLMPKYNRCALSKTLRDNGWKPDNEGATLLAPIPKSERFAFVKARAKSRRRAR